MIIKVNFPRILPTKEGNLGANIQHCLQEEMWLLCQKEEMHRLWSGTCLLVLYLASLAGIAKVSYLPHHKH